MIPKQKSPIVAGFGVESIEYHLGGTFRGSYYTLKRQHYQWQNQGHLCGGCNNARTKHNEGHVQIVKELIERCDCSDNRMQCHGARNGIASGCQNNHIVLDEFFNDLNVAFIVFCACIVASHHTADAPDPAIDNVVVQCVVGTTKCAAEVIFNGFHTKSGDNR